MTHEKKVGVKTIKWGHCLNVIGWGASAKGMDEGNDLGHIQDQGYISKTTFRIYILVQNVLKVLFCLGKSSLKNKNYIFLCDFDYGR
jgi:hypothetical protein